MKRAFFQKMKTVVYRGGVVLFDLPENWKEEYGEDAGGLFYHDKSSGTLRVNVTTSSIPEPASRQMVVDLLKDSLQKNPGSVFVEKNGNPMLVYERKFWETWKKCYARYWEIGNFVPPNFGRIALFSYTVLNSELKNEDVQADLKMLSESIGALRFSTGISHSTDGGPRNIPSN